MYYVYVVELEGICLDYLFLPEYKHIIGIILLQYLNSLNYFAGFSFLNTIPVACSNEHGKIQYHQLQFANRRLLRGNPLIWSRSILDLSCTYSLLSLKLIGGPHEHDINLIERLI